MNYRQGNNPANIGLGTSRVEDADGRVEHSGLEPTDKRRWAIDDADYSRLRDVVFRLLSIDLMHYRTQQMERRLTSFLERSGHKNWTDYVQALGQKPEELQRFLQFLTINVSSFYRDADKWNQLAQWILPELLRQTEPRGIQAWSIGCSIGAEPYTLAMLLQEKAPGRHHRIYAGDIDKAVLERARAGGPYSLNDLREMPQRLMDKYLVAVDENQFRVRPKLRSLITFEHFDLLQDRMTRLHDLIICRNLTIYFTPLVKERVFRGLVQAVKLGGILFIGSTETITHYRQYGLDYLSPAFYRRIA